jgi:hypothetical protein
MRLGNDYPQITPITQIQNQYNLDVGGAAAIHAEGVTDSSRWSADHRITNQQIRHAEGVQDVWHAFSVQTIIDVIRWSSLRYDHRLLSRKPSGLPPDELEL